MDIRVSANEDVWIYLSMLNRAKKVQSIPRFFYVYNTERGVSTNTHISSFDSFIKEIQDDGRYQELQNKWKYG